MRGIYGRAQQPLQTVPRRQNLSKRSLIGNAALAVNGDPFGHLDAEALGAGAACL